MADAPGSVSLSTSSCWPHHRDWVEGESCDLGYTYQDASLEVFKLSRRWISFLSRRRSGGTSLAFAGATGPA